ncbi:YceH family protein [Geothrix fuzhouensis]|uniref:YceH family protein n=1 Tax=Geothrix fuzhouensis TaxID=2966451 RepID=UPI0027D2D60F|nr:YceH family protein [Geothrix fuzhouensis]
MPAPAAPWRAWWDARRTVPDFELAPFECRVLGCLLEKQLSTPDIYPLSLNALVNACNQSSNREPVLAMTEAEVQAAVDALIARGLAEPWPGRVLKVAHTAKPTWNLSVQEAALLAELLLRGPQTPGELRTNTRRMYVFPDLAELESCLTALMEAEPPLALRLPRAPGAREARTAHLLSGPVAPETAPQGPTVPLAPGRMDQLEAEVSTLREELAELREAFEAFKAQF